MIPSKSNKDLTAYPSLGKTLKDAGYSTTYFGKWHVSHSKMDKVKDWHRFELYKDIRDDSKIEEKAKDYLT